jgi:signal peptidase I
MRPTFKEEDHLTVTKTAFGINVPLETRHFYFDPALVQRTSIFIFSGDGIPLLDAQTKYFGIIPYTKRYIKRCIAKPGDSLYFYGGKIYGIDSQGNDIKELRDAPWMQSLEHIPFLSFDGQISSGPNRSAIFKQMDLPAGRLSMLPSGKTRGEVFNGTSWVLDDPTAESKPHTEILTYSDILGIRNFAMARLLTKDELAGTGEKPVAADGIVLYLELHHTPSLTYPTPLIQREGAGSNISVQGFTTSLPLQQKHLDAIMNAMYTTRFVVADGRAKKYDISDHTQFDARSPKFPGVPDGTYEFYFGKATQIHWAGISTNVPNDSPLYSKTPDNIQKLFNLGVEMNTVFAPKPNTFTPLPHRYAYFRDGDLYLLGSKIFDKTDPILVAFHQSEAEKERTSTQQQPYVAFKDYGAPIKDGVLDAKFIKTFGFTVPERHYLALGDNHAMSSDSRVFGAIPEDNLQGAPCWILWPPGDRLGSPDQKPYPFMNIPRAIVWTIAGIIGLISWLYFRWKHRRPMVKLLK